MNAVLVSWENVQSQSGLPEGMYSEDQVKRAQNPVVLTERSGFRIAPPDLLPVIVVTRASTFRLPLED